MRSVSLFALAVSGLVLAGCGGSSGDSGVFMSDASFDLCGVNEVNCDLGGGNNAGGGGSGGGGTTPPNVGGGGGNTTSGLTTGNTTIALENGQLVSPQATGALSLMTITADNPATAGVNESAATYAIDTKSSNNPNWPRQRTISEFVGGSNAPNFFGSPVNLGAGVTGYKEYRDSDVALQVWDFGHSHASAFRVISPGESSHKAFAFGGTKTPTTSMPTGGTASYTGSYGSNGTAKNWIAPQSDIPDIVIVDPNMVFMSNGSSNFTANFASSTMIGNLNPQHWTWFDAGVWRYDVAADTLYAPDGTTTTGNFTQHIVPGYFDNGIGISATITGNNYTGTASMAGSQVLNTQNPVYGSFFGPTLNETTGVFSVQGQLPYPLGGEYTGIDDRAGFVTHSGVFNGNCSGGTGCAP
jgi:hypothetical protein